MCSKNSRVLDHSFEFHSGVDIVCHQLQGELTPFQFCISDLKRKHGIKNKIAITDHNVTSNVFTPYILSSEFILIFISFFFGGVGFLINFFCISSLADFGYPVKALLVLTKTINYQLLYIFDGCFMVFNGTFNNISVMSWRSVLLVEETGVLRENHRPVASQRQTLSQNVVSSQHTSS